MLVSALLVLAASQLLPYPGRTYEGELVAEQRSCRVVAWEGWAPALWLFDEQEKSSLAAIGTELDRVAVGKESEATTRRALSRFLKLLQEKPEKAAGHTALFSARSVTYRSLAVSCDGQLVRAGLAQLPAMHGMVLVALYPETGESVWIADLLPDTRALAELDEKLATRHRGAGTPGVALPASSASPPPSAENPAEAGKAWEEAAEQGRIRLWKIAGQTFPGCAERCEPAIVQQAWSALSPQARKALAPLLGALSRRKLEEQEPPAEHPPKALQVPRLLLTWPETLGENPFLAAEWKVFTSQAVPSFEPPTAERAREIFGTAKPRLPEFEELEASKLFAAIAKSLR